MFVFVPSPGLAPSPPRQAARRWCLCGCDTSHSPSAEWSTSAPDPPFLPGTARTHRGTNQRLFIVRQQTADTGRETQQAKKDQPDYTERGLRGGFLQRSHGASVCVSRVCCCKPHLFSGPLCFIFTHSKTDGNKQPDRQKATCLTPTYLISNVYLCMCVCGCNLVS